MVSGVHRPGDPGLPLGQVFPCHGHCAQVKSFLKKEKNIIDDQVTPRAATILSALGR